jgi:hypothetical protein
VRLTRSPVASIALIRGRATGNGSELTLACDMSFASREKALISQWGGRGDFVEIEEVSEEKPRIAVTVWSMAIDYRGLRSLTARELIAALTRDGLYFVRQKGSHQRYRHPDGRA